MERACGSDESNLLVLFLLWESFQQVSSYNHSHRHYHKNHNHIASANKETKRRLRELYILELTRLTCSDSSASLSGNICF
ncbi:hypothetical protein CPC08DRAFT_217243 [Agrocybe pediades]|nr:hypothetical protein CPC08DRAFT_217243 [Agrocybe pediades]